MRRGLEPVMTGATILEARATRPDLRFPLPERFGERLSGRRILALGRRAKYLLVHLDGGEALVCHLGMSGSFRIEDDAPGRFHHARGKDARHDHVMLTLATANGEARTVVYNDPRRFGFMWLVAEAGLEDDRFLRGLGVEPTGNALSGTTLLGLFAGKAAPIKAALLDQHLIAGIGNIYACEALHRARLSPGRRAGELSSAEAGLLADAVRSVIAEAIEAGGSSLRDHRQADGSLGYFQHRFAVYDREGEACQNPSCHGTIARMVQSGRSTFFCPACQPAPKPATRKAKP